MGWLTFSGCWYCHEGSGALVFSREFDTYVHLECLRGAVKHDPKDGEASIMAKELLVG